MIIIYETVIFNNARLIDGIIVSKIFLADLPANSTFFTILALVKIAKMLYNFAYNNHTNNEGGYILWHTKFLVAA